MMFVFIIIIDTGKGQTWLWWLSFDHILVSMVSCIDFIFLPFFFFLYNDDVLFDVLTTLTLTYPSEAKHAHTR